MPIGDSITEGGETLSRCYRYPLRQKLSDNGYNNVKFIGTRKSPSCHGDLYHEGYGGKNATYIVPVVSRNYEQLPADVVLLHMGHNFSSEDNPIPIIISETKQLIDTLLEINSNVKVLLATVIPSGNLPKYSYIPGLNKEIKKLGEHYKIYCNNIIIVDLADNFNWETDTVDDKVHPNTTGAEKIASEWYKAIVAILK